MPTPPTEDDEELRLEISETTDPLDHTITVNEIRFINNGIDVTANVKKFKSEASDDSTEETDKEEGDDEVDGNNGDNKSEIRKQAESLIDELEDELDKKVEEAKTSQQEMDTLFASKSQSFSDKVGTKLTETKDSIGEAVKNAGEAVDAKLTDAKESLGTAAARAATGARSAAEVVSDNAKKAARGAKQSMKNMTNSVATAGDEAKQAVGQVGDNVSKATGETKEAMGSALRKMAGDTKQAVGAVTSKISSEVQEAKNSLSTMLQGRKNKVDVEKPLEEHIETEAEPKTEATSKESGDGDKSNNTTQSNTTTTGIQEDDERTTASANSNHTSSAGNPFENAIPFDPELDAMVQRGKQALREELQAASVAAENGTSHVVDDVVEEKSKFSKFLDDMREKSKNLSCRNEKSIKIIEGK